jgi:CRP-like cAMP-binding protein
MEQFLSTAIDSPLFAGIASKDLASMMKCLGTYSRIYEKGETILHVGDVVTEIGLVRKGRVYLTKEDHNGNSNLLAEITPGHLFGEELSCIGQMKSDVNIISAQKTEVLFLDIGRVTTQCSTACVFHQRLIRNLLTVIAAKNHALNAKMEHMSKRTTKEKLLSYLSSLAGEDPFQWFEIPFNRQQLADYLSVERSAMSWELCKLRDEGLIEFQKNRFRFTGG